MPLEEFLWRGMCKIEPRLLFIPKEKKKEIKEFLVKTLQQNLTRI